MQYPEILAPAGNLEKLKFAVLYGADAVYLGGKVFGLRAGAGNFTLEEITEGIEFAHSRGVKVFVAVNIFAHNEDLKHLPRYLRDISDIGVDAIICSDPGIISIAQQTIPEMTIHLSTQANNTNWASVLFWENIGIKRIVLARELSLPEITEISQKTTAELEVFVHGAMCISYSGRCLLSNYLTQRDANQGACSHPCRWKYELVEEKRPDQQFPIEEDDRGTYIFNSKDLCLLPHLPELFAAGVSSFKIEGRVKSAFYVATVVKIYREALKYIHNKEEFDKQVPFLLEELKKVSHRDYTEGFYSSKPGHKEQKYETSSYTRTHDFVGLVLEYFPEKGLALIEQRNNFKVGDELEIFGPKTDFRKFVLTNMYDEAFSDIDVAPHPQQKIYIKIPFPTEPYALLRRQGK